MSLRDTIHQIQNRNAAMEAIANGKDEFIQLWVEDIRKLFNLLLGELKEFIDDGSIKSAESQTSVKEAELGEYRVPRLVLDIAGRHILVVPVARVVVGFTGRVDMYRNDRTLDEDRFRIVREAGPNATPGPWLIEARDGGPNSFFARLAGGLNNPTRYVPLWGSVERAVDYLLKIS